MKKLLVGCVLALTMALAATQVQAQTNPVDQLTGALWMASSEETKLALVYGVECAITVEYYVADRLAEQEKAKGKKKGKQVSTLSPFEKGWVSAFNGVSREKIVADLNAWYKSHPDQWTRPVFSVLWMEMIQPKLQKR